MPRPSSAAAVVGAIAATQVPRGTPLTAIDIPNLLSQTGDALESIATEMQQMASASKPCRRS